jgi:hypothetical protein
VDAEEGGMMKEYYYPEHQTDTAKEDMLKAWSSDGKTAVNNFLFQHLPESTTLKEMEELATEIWMKILEMHEKAQKR